MSKPRRANLMFIVLGAVTVPFLIILGPLLFESYDPVWETMTCDEMIDWSGSDAHDVMGDRGHMEFHNYYFDNCMNEPVDNKDMTYNEFMEDLGVMREEIREDYENMKNMTGE